MSPHGISFLLSLSGVSTNLVNEQTNKQNQIVFSLAVLEVRQKQAQGYKQCLQGYGFVLRALVESCFFPLPDGESFWQPGVDGPLTWLWCLVALFLLHLTLL